ncbi:HIT domain-containing protein [Candidatus Woesearchaeota archaeon]|nr:HIT domain-containing protein [Candidatus Woesearchaeota archaeon]
MADCLICDIIDEKVPSKKVYEDDDVLAFLDYNGAAAGHTFVVPKKHFPIFEQVPDSLAGKLFSISNKISTALFESLNVQGTNVFVTNGVSAGQGVPHFIINVIPRKEGDNISMQWKPKQLSEEEMSTVELRIKEQTEHLGISANAEKKDEKREEKREKVSGDGDNYLWRSVNRRIA